MLKPLELPWRVRLWHFIRGLLFYNTVYWKRASDDLNPPTLSREERRNYQPARNPEIIRPREHPRAKLGAARGGQVSLPTIGTLPPAPEPTESAMPEADASQADAVDEASGEDVIIKRRRYRRRHSKVRPSQVGKDPTQFAKASYFGWLFPNKKRR